MRSSPGWLAFLGTLAIALVRVLFGQEPEGTWRASEPTRVKMFGEMAALEASTRVGADLAFPGDPWSADDDFHNHELRQARGVAAANQVGVADVLRALDEGMRSRWPLAGPAPLRVTVPPCRPRPNY